MAKSKTVYTCTECGGQTLKWQGQCPHCSAWNTLVETIAEKTSSRYPALAQSSKLQKLYRHLHTCLAHSSSKTDQTGRPSVLI